MSVLRKIQQRINTPQKIAVMEVLFAENGETQFAVAGFERKKTRLENTFLKTAIQDIETALTYLKDKNVPLCVCVDGKGILHRRLNFSIEDFDETQLGKVIPNARAEDFVFEQTRITETVSYLFLTRNSSLQEIFEKTESKGLMITSIHIGPAVISCMAGVLCGENESLLLKFRNFSLLFHQDGLREITHEEQYANESPDLLLRAAAVAYFSGWNFSMRSYFCQYVQQRAVLFSEKRKFAALLMSSVGFFLVLLVANFFIFQHYWDKQQILQSEVGWQESALKDYDELKKSIGEKMSFALESGLLSSNNLSELSDKIAATVPQGIVLNRMSLYPREKKMLEGEERVYFDQQHILLSGTSDSGSLVEDWIRTLQQQNSFVRKARLTRYKKEEEKGNEGAFDVEITLK